jgi:hypothetical protein
MALVSLSGLFASDKVLASSFVCLFAGATGFLVVVASGHKTLGSTDQPYMLVSANKDFAVVGSREGLRRMTVGAVLPGFGQVSSIQQGRDGWSLIFSTGKVLHFGQL